MTANRELMTVLILLAVTSLIAISCVIVGNALRRSRGTTLFAPLVWALISLVSVTAAEIAHFQLAAVPAAHDIAKWWLVAICSTFCPLTALLGAKRPQNRAWQWIVISFWVVAALPAIEALVMQPAEPLSVPIIWRWLYAALILLAGGNYLPTRFLFPAVLAVVGQTLLFWPFLPFTSHGSAEMSMLGFALTCAAICIAALLGRFQWPRKLPQSGTSRLAAWTKVWSDFRDSYGLLWGARMMERIDTLLRASQFPGWLQWDGFQFPSPKPQQADSEIFSPRQDTGADGATSESALDCEASFESVEPSIRSLLLRFVSHDWIDRRLNCARNPSGSFKEFPTGRSEHTMQEI
jgi:hypothetical protein